ncbi:MAG: hypothetical protein ABI539_01475 [Acidobacteriota bacterium]
MVKFIIGCVLGLLVGLGGGYYAFVGFPNSSDRPGQPIKPPDPNTPTNGVAQITIGQDFFTNVLDTIFRDMRSPTFDLDRGNGSSAGSGCENRITVLQQGSGTTTTVEFKDGRITAPLALEGSYNSLVGCLKFTGAADANFELRYDPADRSVYGIVMVERVSIDGVNPIFASLITPVVQSTLNSRVNPIKLVNGSQLDIGLPVESAKGTLNGKVQDVRAEIKDGALNLFVNYGFNGAPAVPPAAQ